MKKILLPLLICLTSTVFAVGSRDVTVVDITSMESWQETVDIAGKKAGKYNVLVTATDIAGNAGYAGPFNLYIDPASDLPVTQIAFPAVDSAVTGNVDIVGTCIDDDGIAQVQLRIDGGADIYSPKGTEFWLYSLNTQDMSEGLHTVEAWAVDVNGIVGKSVKTSFYLDRRQPLTGVTNMNAGSLVSGVIRLEGSVEDGNGIDRLFYSLDNGVKFEEAVLTYNKKTKKSQFKITVDTEKIGDGPNVCWFKAVDKQGSTGIYTFLFFVDNVPPLLSFIYPDNENETFPSIFSVAGKASDGTGLESLKWVCGKESGEIPITPGNEYWIKEFDLTRVNAKSAVIEIIAKDVAGNTVKAKKNIQIDKTKDKPVLELVYPKPDSYITDNLFISALAYGITQVSEVRYKIDKGEEKIVSTETGAVGISEEGIPAGAHTLTIYPVNAQGIAGDVRTVKFTAGGKAPDIAFENGGTVIPVYSAQDKVSTAVRIKADAGLQSLSVGYDGGEESSVSLKSGQTDFLLKSFVNEKTPAGLHSVSVTAVDILGRTVRQTLAASVGTSSAEENRTFMWAQRETGNTASAVIDSEHALYGLYYSSQGALIEQVELIGSDDLVAEFDGNKTVVRARRAGVYKDIRLKIRDSQGFELTSSPADILFDDSPPAIVLENSAEPAFIKDSFFISGNINEDGQLHSVEYQLYANTGEPVQTGKLDGAFEKELNVKEEADGLFLLAIHARNQAGMESTAYRSFIKDSEAPFAVMVSPAAGDKVNGSITVAFKVSEKLQNAKAEYKADEENAAWKEFEYSSLPNVVIGSAAEPISKKMQFRFTDLAGNVQLIDRYDFEIDNTVDAPTVEIHLPFEDQVVFKDFELSGMIYDDDAPARIYYKIDDEPYRAVDAEHSFTVPIALSSLTDNTHTISIYGEDIYGVKSVPVTRNIRVSLAQPESQMLSPAINETVRGIVNINGTASDNNGIGEVYISVNNGNIFCLAEGAEEWTYEVNTQVIGDGTHVVFIKTVDNYGRESVSSSLINIDNTPPVLKIEYPLAGSSLDTDLFVSGQARDNISLEGVTLKIKSLSGTEVPASLAQIDLKTDLLISEAIQISSLPEGRYNLEISGIDKAGNVSESAVNFDVRRKADKDKIELLYPLNGENLYGEFNVYGRTDPSAKIRQVSLFIDGTQIETTDVSETGYAAFKLNPDLLSEGLHRIEIKGILADNTLVVSNACDIQYRQDGPWITVDNLAMGDFAIDRPYLKGRAGYAVSQEEKDAVFSKTASAEEKRLYAAKRLKSVEVSFDNGKTFKPAKLKNGWEYRIETEYMSEGNHFLLVRAVMENKEIAVCRTIVKIDNKIPSVTLISPGAGGRYNGSMTFIGLASDNADLQKVDVALRKGDKSSYGLPKFIQGLHFELGFWGATLWNAGIGLNFFDDNVKIQFHYGQFTQKQFDSFYKAHKPIRYGGHVGSIKLLANILEQPFGYYFGPDWQWLYLNVALGAQFSLFSHTQSGKPQVLSAILTQVEFPRIKLYKRRYLSSFSVFTEGQLWFIPTDVTSKKIPSVVPHICGGLRFNIF